MGGMKGIGGAISGVLPYAGAAASGYSQGMQNRRQLEQGERQLLLQEAENEMKRRGLTLDEQRTAATVGPTDAPTASAYGEAFADPQFGAALTGLPYNQTQDIARFKARGNADQTRATIAASKPRGGKSIEDRDLALTREIRNQEIARVSIDKTQWPARFQDAVLQRDPDIKKIYDELKEKFTPAQQFFASEIVRLIEKRNALTGENAGYRDFAPDGAPTASPRSPVKPANKGAPVEQEYDKTGKRIK